MKRDASAPCQTSMNTGMAWSILTEIRALLKQLAETGKPAAIDLRSLPLTTADRAQLEDLVGRGEVSASLDVLGRTEIWETGFAGVWWIRHMGAEDQVSSEEIAITPIPDILRAHPADIAAAADRLVNTLEIHSKDSRVGHEEGEHV